MTKQRISGRLRQLVRRRAKGYCEYCLCPEACATQSHSIEHIMPKSRGGTSTEDNLALSCQGCNGSKYNKTQSPDPMTNRAVPLFHPRKHDWHEHFVWSPDGLYLTGLSPIGRATIQALDLNRDGVIRLRRLLLLDREHPPPHSLPQ